MRRRRARLGQGLSAAVAVLAVVVPSSAFGSITLGSNLATAPSFFNSCPTGCFAVNNVLPGANLVAPSDGVIVRWRVRLGGSTDAQQLRIRTVRRFDADQFTVVSSGEFEDIPAGAGTYAFPARLRITAGDQLGIESGLGTAIQWGATLTGGTVFLFAPPADGVVTPAPAVSLPNREIMFNADFEPDADGDGYGDETQDRCATNPSVQGACPSGGGEADTDAPEVEITKGAPNKLDKSKVRFKFLSDDPTATFECKLKGKGMKAKFKKFSDCSSPRKYKRLDEGKHKFQVRATDPAGNVGDPAKDRFKVVD